MSDLKLKSSLIAMPTCLALLVGLSACTVYKSTTNKPLVSIKNEIIGHEQKTSIFYYHVNPVNHAQSAAVVEGTFAWKEGCIYLVGKDGVYDTAMFPLYPKGIVRWNEATKTLHLNGHIFNMGDSIVSLK